MGWVAKVTPRPLYHRENDSVSRVSKPQDRSGRVWKISPPPGFDPQTVQPVASRYTDWANQAHILSQGWRTYGTRAQNSMRKELLCTRIHCSPNFLYFFSPTSVFTLWRIYMRVGTLTVATIYLQLIQNRYMFRSFTVLQYSHQHCVQPVASDVEVVGYL